MGMSSSQARLLTLTSRMHQIEYKAAKLEAEKLQMANESTRVYEDYLFALEKTNVQAGFLTTDGTTAYINTSLQMLEGNTDYKIANTLYLKDAESDKVYVSPAMAAKYNLDGTGVVGDLNTFMANAGFIATVPGCTVIPNELGTTSYSPVATNVIAGAKRNVPNINPDAGYQAVSHSTVPADAVAVSSVTGNFDPAKTYVIKSKDDLIALQNLANAGKSTAGVKFVLGANIDMSGVNWTGIGSTQSNAFKGVFDGNGYTISNLTSTNSGLFKYVAGNQVSTTSTSTGVTTTATEGVIKNVKLTGLNITNTGVGVKGGIAGYAKNAYVDNCYTEGSIQGSNWTAGMIGQNEGSAIANSTANVNITATSTCVGGFLGHDTNGILSNCVSMGNVKSSNVYVGGLIGHETSQGGVNGSSFIFKCSTISTVNGAGGNGAFIGQIDGACSATVIGSQYSSASGVSSVGGGADKLTSDGSGASLTGDATREVTTNKVTVPSKRAVAANIALMLEKSGQTVDASKISTWLNQFYQVDANFSDGSLVKKSLKLASINDAVTNYLKNGSNPSIATALVSDITNNTLTATAGFQNNYVETKDYEYSPFADSSSTLPSKNSPITIPSVKNVSNNLYTVLHDNGYANASSPDDVMKVLNWVTNNYPTSTQASKLALANLNAYINDIVTGANTDKTELNKIYAAIQNGTSYTMPAAAQKYSSNEYTVTSMVEQPQSSSLQWDMNDKDIADAVNYYEVLKNGYILTTDEQSKSNEWLTNMINSGSTVLVEVNRKNQTAFETSVATNTGIQEVSDETLIKKAEAKYEADMKKIDMKDRKYDSDLAALDNERNAIKQEMETLKTVAKENVERTFKLFS